MLSALAQKLVYAAHGSADGDSCSHLPSFASFVLCLTILGRYNIFSSAVVDRSILPCACVAMFHAFIYDMMELCSR